MGQDTQVWAPWSHWLWSLVSGIHHWCVQGGLRESSPSTASPFPLSPFTHFLGGSSASSPLVAPLTTRPGSLMCTCNNMGNKPFVYDCEGCGKTHLKRLTSEVVKSWFIWQKSHMFVQLVAVIKNSTQNQTWRDILQANMKTSKKYIYVCNFEGFKKTFTNISSWKTITASIPMNHYSTVPRKDVGSIFSPSL